MRVLILSQFFEPEPIVKPFDLAKALIKRGHSVWVLTGLPNYPTGKLYSGYRSHLFVRETIEGVPVIRTWLFASHSRSSLGRMLNYGTFMLSSVIGSLLIPKCDVMYVWHPPLTIGLSAWLIGRLKQIPFVYDVQDIWPESGIWSGMLGNSWLVWLLRGMEKFIYARAKHLLVVTDGAKGNLMRKKVPAVKISIASHWIDEKLFAAVDLKKMAIVHEKYNFTGRFVVMYAGNIGLVQGLDTVLETASLLREDPQVLFVFLGEGTDRERLIKMVHGKKLANVIFIDRQPVSEMPHFMGNAQVLLLHLNYSELSALSIPLKTFAYMAAGRPILAAVDGASAKLVEEAGAGIVVAPQNSKAMAEAVLKLMRMPQEKREGMGLSGQTYLVKHHSKEDALDSYVQLLGAHALNNSHPIRSTEAIPS